MDFKIGRVCPKCTEAIREGITNSLFNSACSFALCFKQGIQKVPSGFYRLFLLKNLGCFSLNL